MNFSGGPEGSKTTVHIVETDNQLTDEYEIDN